MKYFYQSVPSFYQFFYLPIIGILTLWTFLYLPLPFIFLTLSIVGLSIYSMHTKKGELLWSSLFILALSLRLFFIQSEHAQCARDLGKQKIECSGTVIDVKQNITQASVLLQTECINQSPSTYTFILHWPYYQQTPNAGDTIVLTNITLTWAKNNYLLYLYKEGAHATAHVAKKNIASVTPHATQTPLNLENKLISTLLQTILLGQKINNALYTHVKKICNEWGIRHYLARSGLHFSILFFLILFLLSYLPTPWHLKQILISGLCILFYITTWYSVSFLRAFIFYLLVTGCNIFYLRIIPLHLLNITFCFVLIYNPFSLYFLDFQLTFCATYLLLWLNKIGIFAQDS